jgi:hypothetical protein
MKRIVIAAIAVACIAIGVLVAQSAKSPPVVGICQDVIGTVSITRAGKVYDDIDPGVTKILDGDMIKTEGDGLLVFQTDKATGFTGTITIKAKTVLYVSLKDVKGQKQTSLNVVSGSVASKVAKLTGSPSMVVNTESAVMAVRGTEYSASSSINGNVMFTCTEGSVTVSETGNPDAKGTLSAGKAVERRSGAQIAFVDTTGIDLRRFADRWMLDEIGVFKANIKKAVDQFMALYDENRGGLFDENYEQFQTSEIITRWLAEERSGTAKVGDPDYIKLKPLMLKIRAKLFIFERIYYRVLEIKSIAEEDPAILRVQVRAGVTVGDFLRRVEAEKDLIAKRIAFFRFIEQLAAKRSMLGEDSSMDF